MKKSTKFAPGTSGNAAGRPVGRGKAAELRKALLDAMPSVFKRVYSAAMDGDLTACSLLMSRCLAPVRAAEEAAPFPMPDGTPAQQARSVMKAAADGLLGPSEASVLIGCIGSVAKIVSETELIDRLEKLEKALDENSIPR